MIYYVVDYLFNDLVSAGEVIKITIEDYVQHLSQYNLRLTFEPELTHGTRFQYHNRIHAEFNHLYHWHPLIPDTLNVSLLLLLIVVVVFVVVFVLSMEFSLLVFLILCAGIYDFSSILLIIYLFFTSTGERDRLRNHGHGLLDCPRVQARSGRVHSLNGQ